MTILQSLRHAVPALAAMVAIGVGGGALCEESFRDRILRCSSCHGVGGISTKENVPSLAGQPELFLVTQLILFREGVRLSERMNPQARGLTDKDITALASYFASRTPAASARQPISAPLTQRGGALARKLRCGQCHLPDFSGREQIPRLAGQRRDYLAMTMRAYRNDERRGADTIMTDILNGLSDQDIEALAHFVSAGAR